jgi:hypothetical protein
MRWASTPLEGPETAGVAGLLLLVAILGDQPLVRAPGLGVALLFVTFAQPQQRLGRDVAVRAGLPSCPLVQIDRSLQVAVDGFFLDRPLEQRLDLLCIEREDEKKRKVESVFIKASSAHNRLCRQKTTVHL